MTEIELTPKRKEILAKKGIRTKEDLAMFFPRKYKDYTMVYEEVSEQLNGKEGCFIGVLKKLNSKRASTGCSCVSFKLIMKNDTKVNVNFFGKAYIKNILETYKEERVVVCGKLQYHPVYGYSITDPDHTIKECYLRSVQKIDPVYTKISGISEKALDELITDALGTCTFDEINRGKAAREGITLMPLKQAIHTIHYPKSMDEIDVALHTVHMNELYTFARDMEKKQRDEAVTTDVKLRTFAKTKELIGSLPYELTKDQKDAYSEMLKDIREAKRVSALLQGDVGCGKSIVTFLLMISMAENGYQGVIMAPTAILAKQHYYELKGYAEQLGITVGYLDGTVKASAKKELLRSLADGSLQILVGTQAISSTDPTFNNLGMIAIDEEHRFGVEQREVLMKYAKDGVNTMLMSATPMPRSLANTYYGNSMKVYDIHTMPACRIPVQTAINNSDKVIFDFVEGQLKQGRQAYVVCPLIETNDEAEVMKDVISVTEKLAAYKERFEPQYRIEMLNGKMKEEEMASVIDEFKKGNIHVLISTTVIEVGVNVPNASVIVISNAERFGLAAMHQLRGRVGRGSYKSYCILQSTEKDNERLRTLVDCADGFSIAQMDLKLRGAGELTGVKQSGFTKQMELVFQYPKEYDILKKMAKEA